jgi:hypothetical protein
VPEIVDIPIPDLLLNGSNPRLAGDSSTQQEVALELARQQGDNIVRMAEDIVANGLDPTALPAVVATGDRRKRYKVMEGNRRILAVRALDTPSLISPVLSQGSSRRLSALAARYEKKPLTAIHCALFETEESALHWIQLRHTGQNQGIGLVEWGAVEKDRFNALHAGKRKPAGQLIDFVENLGGLSSAAQSSTQRILTNVERLLSTPYAREKLGIDVVDGEVVSYYPAEEVAKGLTRVVEDFKTGKITVPALYHLDDRKKYVDSLPTTTLPKRSTRLKTPVVLDDLASGTKTPRTIAAKPPRRRRPAPRTTVIPKSAQLDVTHPRINQIYNELLSLNAELYPNACSVLLRVFIELSVDHYVASQKLMTDEEMRNTPLAKRLRITAKDLSTRNLIPTKLLRAIETIASSKTAIVGPTIATFHQYVHNEYVFPKSADLYSAWDELEPFAAKLWPSTP